MRHLIINADDYGYTEGVSAGIRRAHRAGVVTSTSVMMPMPRALDELRRLGDDAPSLGVGVHLTLTEGQPFRLPRFPTRRELPQALRTLDANALRAEWQAQIEAYLVVGRPLTHLDSHHHAAFLHERALTVLFKLAEEYRVPVRQPYPIGDEVADRLSARFADSGLRYPSRFSDVFDGLNPGLSMFLERLETLDEGVTEFMVHPGDVDDELRRLNPTFADARAKELEVLVDPAVRAAISRLSICLVSFARLAAPTGG